MRERIEFVIVANRATGGQAKPDLRRRFRAVARVEHADIPRRSRRLRCGDIAAIEAAGDFLVERVVGQQIAGELLDGELVERLVAIEGVDDPIAIRPHLAVIIEVNAVGIGVTRGVEPITGAMFAVLRRVEQAVHQFLVGIGRFIFDERFDFLRRRRQAGQIERDAASKRAAVGLGRGLEALLVPAARE